MIDRIDPTIDFDCCIDQIGQTGKSTQKVSDYYGVRWTGKIKVPTSELYTFYITADDSAVVYLNHSLLLDTRGSVGVEFRSQVLLRKSVYYDLLINFTEVTGAASVRLSYSSNSIKKQVVPSSVLFYSLPVVGSPFTASVISGK